MLAAETITAYNRHFYADFLLRLWHGPTADELKFRVIHISLLNLNVAVGRRAAASHRFFMLVYHGSETRIARGSLASGGVLQVRGTTDRCSRSGHVGKSLSVNIRIHRL